MSSAIALSSLAQRQHNNISAWPDGKQSRTKLGPLPRNAWVVICQGTAEPEILRNFDAARWSAR